MNRNFADQLSWGLQRIFVADQPIPPQEFLQRDLTDDGTTSGSDLMNVDGSITPVDFWYTVPSGKLFLFHRLVLQIVDGSVDWAGFGGIAALTNGVLITIYDDQNNAIIALPALKENYEIAMQFGAGAAEIRPGAANSNLIAVYDVHEQAGYVFGVPAGWKFQVTIQDNLTAITHMDALVTGRLIDYP